MTTTQSAFNPARDEANEPRPVLYRTFWGGNIVLPSPFRDSIPVHADCARYDLAFHHPVDVSLLIFPKFEHRRYGSTGGNIAVGRWESFGFELKPVGIDLADAALDAMDFISYRPVPGSFDLRPVTLSGFLRDTDFESRILGWRVL